MSLNFFVHISPNNFARQRLFKIREGHAISLDSYFRSNRNKYYRLGLCPVSNRNQRFFSIRVGHKVRNRLDSSFGYNRNMSIYTHIEHIAAIHRQIHIKNHQHQVF
jgi:hypothetical protein